MGSADASERAQPPSYIATRPRRVALFHEPGPGTPVIYVHGATFPTALSAGWRFDDRTGNGVGSRMEKWMEKMDGGPGGLGVGRVRI